MSRFMCDTSCLVAALCAWHEHHERTVSELGIRARDREELVVAADSLAETYAVLTRLPSPHRLGAEDAMTLLEANWRTTSGVHLTVEETWRALRGAQQLGVAGGQTYDAIIAACASKAGAATLVTWNLNHFTAFGETIRIAPPR